MTVAGTICKRVSILSHKFYMFFFLLRPNGGDLAALWLNY